jgi:hypothetical protein
MRKGERSISWALAHIQQYERELIDARDSFTGPDRPDPKRVNALLIDLHQRHWDRAS